VGLRPIRFLAAALLVLPLVAVPASAVELASPLPAVSVPVPTPSVSLPAVLGGSTSPLPSPIAGAGPAAGAAPTGHPGLRPGSAGANGSSVDSQPVAGTTPAAAADPLIPTLIGPLPSKVPVLPILLPLFAGLLLLLVSAVLAAYRRTQEARRFEALERTKSDFMKLASHELRTPLTVLRGYVSMIREGDIKPDTPAFNRALPIIDDHLSQVNTIVEQMLEAARLEEDSTRLETDRFDLAEVATEAVDSIRHRAGEGHPIVLKGPLRELQLVGDRGRVAAIVEQLLDNAVKYSPAGGEIECSLQTADGQALLTVRDHGLGIAPGDLERVFTRFGRLVTRDNSHIPGAGLGLYLARRHARLMGGDIEVDSRPQKGSAFTLRLPLATPPSPAAGAVEEVPVPL